MVVKRTPRDAREGKRRPREVSSGAEGRLGGKGRTEEAMGGKRLGDIFLWLPLISHCLPKPPLFSCLPWLPSLHIPPLTSTWLLASSGLPWPPLASSHLPWPFLASPSLLWPPHTSRGSWVEGCGVKRRLGEAGGDEQRPEENDPSLPSSPCLLVPSLAWPPLASPHLT